MSHAPLASRLAQTPPALRAPVLVEHLLDRLREALSIDDDGIVHARSRFAELGIDSKRALALKEDLEEELNASLPTTLFFDYPTAERLAAHLIGSILVLDDMPSPSEGTARVTPDSSNANAPASDSENESERPADDLDARARRAFAKYGV